MLCRPQCRLLHTCNVYNMYCAPHPQDMFMKRFSAKSEKSKEMELVVDFDYMSKAEMKDDGIL